MIISTRTISTLLALTLAAAAGGGCTKSARRTRAIERADRYFAAAQYDKAEAAYTEAARMMYPPSPIALRQLGFIYMEEGRPSMALWPLEQAAKAEPENAALQIKLAGDCQTLRRFAEAKEAATRVLKLQPGNQQALSILCEIVQNPQELEQTRQYIEKLRQQDQDRSGYHLALGLLASRSNNLPVAETEFKQALALDAKSSLAHLALATIYVARTNLPLADQAFKDAIQLAPLRSNIPLLYADFLIQTGAADKAKESLLDLSSKAPDYLPPMAMLMRIYFEERKYDQCSSMISKILDREPGHYEALMERGNVSLAKGAASQAVQDFERINSLNPKNPLPQVQYQLALAHLLAGSRTKAVSSLNRALELDTNYVPAKLMLADLDIRQGESPAAVSLLMPLLKQPLPEAIKVKVNILLARAYLAQKSPDQALAIYRHLAELFPKEAQVPFLAGTALMRENRLAEARKEFEKSFQINPKYLPALEELVDLDILESHFPAALERLKKQMELDPKTAVLWLLAAKVYKAQSDFHQTEAALQKAIELDPNLPNAYLMLARLYVESKQYPEALDKLNELTARTNVVTALMEIGEIHEVLKEFDPARDSYEKLLTVNPQFGGALNNLAYLYSEHYNQLDKAYELAEKDRELAPYDPFVADTLGWILYKKGEYSRAVALIQESADKQPSDPEVHYHLGMAHYMMGEEDPARVALQFAVSKSDFPGKQEAEQRLAILAIDPKTASPAVRADLEKRIAKDPADPIAMVRLAAIQERDGDVDKAAATYESAIKQNPQDARAMARLAQLYSIRLNQMQKGLALAKSANKLAPDDPFVSQILGRLVFQSHDDYPYALSLMQSAARMMPGQPDLLHDLAWCFFSVGNTTEAQAAMQSAVQTGVAFASLDDARQFLRMMAACHNPAQPEAAVQVQQALQADASYVPALMASGLIQEHQGHVVEAGQLYEKVLASYPLFTPAARQLAILYARAGNDAKAFDYAEKARPAFPNDAELAKAAGMVAYRRKDYQRSSQLLNQSVQINRDDAESFYYLGMDYYQLKRPADSKKALQRAVDLNLPANLATEARRVIATLKETKA
jgi:tetratricopeptide (TPR) repeat protein